MMRRIGAAILFSGLCLWGASPAGAGVGVGAKLGTLGVGGELTVGLASWLGVRAGYYSFAYEYQRHDNNADASLEDLTARLELENIPLFLDLHPFQGDFRVTFGLVPNNNQITMVGVPGDTLKLNDIEFRLNHIDGRATFESPAPYIGIGTGNAGDRSQGFRFTFDIGVLFQGAPQLEASATASDPAMQEAVNRALADEVASWEEDASSFTVWPVIALGLSYTF